MAVAVSVASLISGAYVARIQDALGDSGATVALTAGSHGSVAITGTPTGEGLKIEAQALQAGAKPTALASDTVSLSPAAQAELSRQEIALALILHGREKPDAQTETRKPPETVSAPQRSSGSSAPLAATDVAALAQEDPTKVVKDVVAAAEATVAGISTTQGFQAAAAADPSFLKEVANMPDGLGASFLAAVAAGTLVVQSGEDAGWDVGGGVRLSGTSESVTAGSTTSGRFDPASLAAGATNVVCTDFGFGQVVFSWPKTNP